MANGNQKYFSNKKTIKVCFKVSEEEFQNLEADVKASGVDRSKYLRALIIDGGFADMTFPKDRATLIRQISGIATNVNQIAKLANSQGSVYFRVIDELMILLNDVKVLLKEVLESWRLRR